MVRINWAFLTQIPKPPGEAGGGMANAIAGSVYILLIASTMGVPVGIGAGIYLAEYGRNRLGNIIRFTADVLNGVPSIIVGIVAYGSVVLTQGHFSALAGGVALAIMMVPTITRTTEEMLLLVPNAGARSGVRVGRLPLAHDAIDHLAHRHFGSDYRGDAGLCTGRGRDCPVAVHRVRQPVLELEGQPAHRSLVACRFLPMRFRPLMSGIARPGRER